MQKETKITRREAHNGSNRELYNRNKAVNWLNDYGVVRVSWLITHRHLKVSEPILRIGERKEESYYEFTWRGKWWHDWYTWTFKDIVKYKIFPVWRLRNAWQRFMIRVFHKHYAWQEYDGVEPRNI